MKLSSSSKKCAAGVSAGELLVAHALVAELQLQVGDDRHQVGVAAPLAVAVHRALHLGGARARPPPASSPPRSRHRRGSGCRRGRPSGRARRRPRPSPRRPRRAACRRWCRSRRPSRPPRRPRRAGTRARTPSRRRSRRRSARRRRSPACPAPTRNATESAIIRRFSSRSTRTTFSRCSDQVLPTSVHTGAKQSARIRSAGIGVRGHVAAAGHAEGAHLGVGEVLARRAARTARAPSGSSSESRPRSGRCRARRAGGRRGPSRPRRGTCPPPACRREGWCRRAGSGSWVGSWRAKGRGRWAAAGARYALAARLIRPLAARARSPAATIRSPSSGP